MEFISRVPFALDVSIDLKNLDVVADTDSRAGGNLVGVSEDVVGNDRAHPEAKLQPVSSVHYLTKLDLQFGRFLACGIL